VALDSVDPGRNAAFSDRILVACALRRETDSLRKHLTGCLDFLTTGVGCRRTRKILTRRFQRGPLPAALIFTGTAGQLDPSCPMGTVLCPETWLMDENQQIGQASRQLLEHLRSAGWDLGGIGVTVSLPVWFSSSRLRLFKRTGASLCDMEAAAALQVAAQFGVPALAPKVISDTGDTSFMHFYRNLAKNLEALAAYLQQLLKDLVTILPSDGCNRLELAD